MGKMSGWVTIAGFFLMLLGLCFLPAALGSHPDEAILGAGVSIFSFGALTCAAGMYLKARALQSGAAAPRVTAAPKRVRGGCGLCGTETPVIHCRVHEIHLCGNCLEDHYDFRSCAYIPSTRRTAPAKPASRFAAKA
jgi:hypothetical protein